VTAEAIAGPLDLDDNGMVQQAIQQRGGDDSAAKDIAPFGKAAVRGQNHGAALVAGLTCSGLQSSRLVLAIIAKSGSD
jgi:hypothetical protein